MKANWFSLRRLISTLIFFAGLATGLAQSGQPWPPGVREIVKLEQANVSDDTVIAYIQNRGRHYHLNAGEIIMLKQQGISDRVLNAMLQNKTVPTKTQRAVTAPYVVRPMPMAPVPAYGYSCCSSYFPYCCCPSLSLYFGWYSGGSCWGGGWHGWNSSCGGGWHGGWHH